jgi:RsiW-degrading membrane proteinase PrsW (M82 family)
MSPLIKYLILAIAPAVALMLYVYYRDKHEKEPLRVMLRAFFYGLLSVVPAAWLEQKFGIMDKNDVVSTAYLAFLVIAGAEEGCKYLFMRWSVYRNPAFNEPFDGIVYCVMVSMGFATVENVMYVLRSDDPMRTALLRMLTAIPAHFTFAVIMGYFVGLSKFAPGKGLRYTIYGVGGAMFFHGAYDFCLILQEYPYIFLGAAVSLLIAIRLSFKALREQSHNSKRFMEENYVERGDDLL